MTPSTAILSDDGTQIYVSCPPLYKEVIKGIPNRKWNPYNKRWELPRTDEAVSKLRLIPNCSIDAKLVAPDVVAYEDVISEGVEPLRDMPIKVKPYAHQIEAYNQALMTFGYTRGGDA